MFVDAYRGAPPDAELLEVGLPAGGTDRVHDAEAVRERLEAAFGSSTVESVPAGPLSAAVGRAID